GRPGRGGRPRPAVGGRQRLRAQERRLRPALRAVRHDEGERAGPGTGGLQDDRRGARRTHLGDAERRPRQHVPSHVAHVRERNAMSPQAERVFVVDDEASVRRSLARLLRTAGLEATAFGSPEEFLDELSADASGCVILDLSMPGLDGLALQRELSSRGSSLPIVSLTGRADVPQSVQAMKGGATDFLTKPVDDEVLLRAVRQALDADRSGREARSAIAAARKRLGALTEREREVLEGV